jgi:hypothetical protein
MHSNDSWFATTPGCFSPFNFNIWSNSCTEFGSIPLFYAWPVYYNLYFSDFYDCLPKVEVFPLGWVSTPLRTHRGFGLSWLKQEEFEELELSSELPFQKLDLLFRTSRKSLGWRPFLMWCIWRARLIRFIYKNLCLPPLFERSLRGELLLFILHQSFDNVNWISQESTKGQDQVLPLGGSRSQEQQPESLRIYKHGERRELR